jgi:type IV fimbrial biogenesis protein FimT
MNTNCQRGFTLFELLVTILVMGVLFGIGVPNLLEFSRNNRMTATANDMLTSIMMARSEAVKQHLPVTLCASPEPLAAPPACDLDASDPDSNGGYIVFVDANADGVLDAGEDLVLQRDDPDAVTVLADNGYIHFARNGFLGDIGGAGSSAKEILLCDDRGNVTVSGSLSAARALRIDPTGRAVVLNEVADIDTLNGTIGLSCP